LIGQDNGLGWVLNLVDVLCSEYKWDFDFTVWRLPLALVFSFYSAICARYEIAPKGPTYSEQEVIDQYFRAEKRRKTKRQKK
jgi:hypothetical protein